MYVWPDETFTHAMRDQISNSSRCTASVEIMGTVTSTQVPEHLQCTVYTRFISWPWNNKQVAAVEIYKNDDEFTIILRGLRSQIIYRRINIYYTSWNKDQKKSKESGEKYIFSSKVK